MLRKKNVIISILDEEEKIKFNHQSISNHNQLYTHLPFSFSDKTICSFNRKDVFRTHISMGSYGLMLTF